MSRSWGQFFGMGILEPTNSMLSHVAHSARELRVFSLSIFFIWQFNQRNWNESCWWVHYCANLSSKGILTTQIVSRIYWGRYRWRPCSDRGGNDKWPQQEMVVRKNEKKKKSNENHLENIVSDIRGTWIVTGMSRLVKKIKCFRQTKT